MALLAVNQLKAFYGPFQALFGIDMTFEEGQTIAIIGANGAGKSTLLKCIAGLIPCPSRALVFDDEPIGAASPATILDKGIAMVPEGRRLFPSLTVEENLRIGGDRRRGSGFWNLESIYRLFPILAERRHAASTSLSGGQQQMVAIGRALMANPQLLLCDEISLGLAPIVVNDIYASLPQIKAQGTTVVIVEQDIARARAASDYAYCLQEGRVTLGGRPDDLSEAQIHQAYFGAGQ
jgi:branched-chain amino acid transport system ATP-binding protein